jgi:HSP20 family molecular chaperone IbpA
MRHEVEFTSSIDPTNTWDGSPFNQPYVGDCPSQGWGTNAPIVQPIRTNPYQTITGDSWEAGPLIYNTGSICEETPETPANIYVDQDGDYHVDVLCAGYRRDQVEVESVKQKVTVVFSSSLGSDFLSDDIENDYIVHEIDVKDKEMSFVVPDEYDVDDLTARRYDDGILRMKFTKRETKKHGIA